MAGEYIEFNNSSQPAINDTNLNRLQQLIKQDMHSAVSGDTLPVGAIMPFGSDTIPENWLLCDGSAVSRTTYQYLFNTIGTTYGTGDGFTTFNLPDLRGRVTIGLDENDTNLDTLGETGEGNIKTQLVVSNSNYAFQQAPGGYAGQGVVSRTRNTDASQIQTLEDNGITTYPPYTVMNYIIKAKQSAGVLATVVDSLNSTSTTDALSANQGKALKELLEGTVLYENSEGSNTNITLSQSANNFDYIEIFFARKGSYVNFSSVKVEDPNNKIVSLGLIHAANADTMQIYGSRISFNGTTLTREHTSMVQVTYTGITTHEETSSIYIYKVVGYKY